LIFQLKFAASEFKLSPNPINAIKSMHKFPVLKTRLSHHDVKYLVSCGDKHDCTLKLWNVAAKAEDCEIWEVATK